MSKPNILVTGATGKTGAATVVQLLERGHPVRALVHRRDARSNQLENLGAEVFVGSLEDIEDMTLAMRGMHRAYFCPPLTPGALRKAVIFSSVAIDAKLEVAVILSQWLVDPAHHAVHAREKWLSENVFAQMTGVDRVTVNPGFFADNYFAALESAAQFGLFAMPLGEGLNAPPSNEDVARVIVGALVNPASHVGKTYRPTGPDLLSPHDIAATFAKVLARPVKYRDAPFALFSKVAKSLDLPDFMIEQLAWFLRDYQRGSFGIGAPTDAVQVVSGHAPESFETITRRYVARSSAVRNGIAPKLRAVWNVIRALVTRAPDLDAIAERLAIPKIAHARLAADSLSWKMQRGAL